LLDSGALYLTFGAVTCIVLGIGAARRLFKRVMNRNSDKYMAVVDQPGEGPDVTPDVCAMQAPIVQPQFNPR